LLVFRFWKYEKVEGIAADPVVLTMLYEERRTAMFTRCDERNYREMLPGVELKTLTHGEAMLLGEFRLKKGAVIPSHSHPHEQIGYLVSGRLRFNSEGETYEAGPGDGWCFTGNCEHGVEVLEDSLVVEVFSPVREDYLP